MSRVTSSACMSTRNRRVPSSCCRTLSRSMCGWVHTTLPPTPPGPEYWYEIEVTLTIFDDGQSVVRLFTDTVPYSPSCTNCVVHSWEPAWDGTDAMGEVVAPRTYTYTGDIHIHRIDDAHRI